jgi:hypothetical protein
MPLFRRNRSDAATAASGTRVSRTDGPLGPDDAAIRLEERHYSVPELAEMWGLSREYVRQIVSKEPGVTEWVRQQPGRRRYRVLRVPRSVAERVYRRAASNAESAAE